MALKCNFTTRSGVQLPESYHQIVRFQGSRPPTRTEIMVQVFKDQAARVAGLVPVDTFRVYVDPNPEGGETIMGGLYGALKKAEGYEGAEDI